jgi:hypothetical protein
MRHIEAMVGGERDEWRAIGIEVWVAECDTRWSGARKTEETRNRSERSSVLVFFGASEQKVAKSNINTPFLYRGGGLERNKYRFYMDFFFQKTNFSTEFSTGLNLFFGSRLGCTETLKKFPGIWI